MRDQVYEYRATPPAGRDRWANRSAVSGRGAAGQSRWEAGRFRHVSVRVGVSSLRGQDLKYHQLRSLPPAVSGGVVNGSRQDLTDPEVLRGLSAVGACRRRRGWGRLWWNWKLELEGNDDDGDDAAL